MNTHKLKTFCTVVEHDSFSKASEKLFCSQPAISKQIRSLENELGYPLFKREGKKISLNDNGKIVYEYSQKILKDISDMKYHLMEINLSDITSEQVLLSQPGSAIRNFIENQLATHGIYLKNKANLYNIEGIKQSLLNGHGISIVPKKSVSTELKYNLLKEIPIEDFKLTRKLFIAYKENKKFTKNELNFIQLLK